MMCMKMLFSVNIVSTTYCLKSSVGRLMDIVTLEEQEIAQSSKLTIGILCQDEVMMKPIKVV